MVRSQGLQVGAGSWQETSFPLQMDLSTGLFFFFFKCLIHQHLSCDVIDLVLKRLRLLASFHELLGPII